MCLFGCLRLSAVCSCLCSCMSIYLCDCVRWCLNCSVCGGRGVEGCLMGFLLGGGGGEYDASVCLCFCVSVYIYMCVRIPSPPPPLSDHSHSLSMKSLPPPPLPLPHTYKRRPTLLTPCTITAPRAHAARDLETVQHRGQPSHRRRPHLRSLQPPHHPAHAGDSNQGPPGGPSGRPRLPGPHHPGGAVPRGEAGGG